MIWENDLDDWSRLPDCLTVLFTLMNAIRNPSCETYTKGAWRGVLGVSGVVTLRKWSELIRRSVKLGHVTLWVRGRTSAMCSRFFCQKLRVNFLFKHHKFRTIIAHAASLTGLSRLAGSTLHRSQ